jgi:hypothetical protein
MLILTIQDGTTRSITRQIDRPLCVDFSDSGDDDDRATSGPWYAHPDADGASLTLCNAALQPIGRLAAGETLRVGEVTFSLERHLDGRDTDRIMPLSRRRANMALKLPDQRRHTLAGRAVIVGSHPECDIVLRDSAVSARHVEVSLQRGGWIARDLGSTNGLWIGGARVPFAQLEPGVLMVIGRTRIECVPEGGAPPSTSQIVGESAAIESVRETIARYAPAPYAILIEGESGVGKELVAREIHARSGRRSGPLVCLNCGAISPDVIESELFGHEKGAFTGADRRRRGAFEEAHGGTLFLDEIGELPVSLQPKLLRVLETGEVRRVGGEGVIRVDVRIVSATLRDLEKRIAEGSFRPDLFFRLQDFRVQVPPLRERRGDIPLLAEALLVRIGAETGKHCQIEDRAMARLLSWHWPGNVRELLAVLKRAVYAAPANVIHAEHVEFTGARGPRGGRMVRDGGAVGVIWPEEVPPGDLAALHAWCGGNLSRVSVITGLARSTIRARLARRDRPETHVSYGA